MVWGKRERACRNQAEVGAVTAEMQRVSERAGPAAPRLAPQHPFGFRLLGKCFLSGTPGAVGHYYVRGM